QARRGRVRGRQEGLRQEDPEQPQVLVRREEEHPARQVTPGPAASGGRRTVGCLTHGAADVRAGHPWGVRPVLWVRWSGNRERTGGGNMLMTGFAGLLGILKLLLMGLAAFGLFGAAFRREDAFRAADKQ